MSTVTMVEEVSRTERSCVDLVEIEGRTLIRKQPLSGGPAALAGLRRAVAVATALQTTSVVARHRLVNDPGGGYLLIDHRGGETLDRVLQRPLPLDIRFELGLQVVLAVSALHRRRLVHGALTADHVLVDLDRPTVELISLGSVRPSEPTIYLAGAPIGADSGACGEPATDLAAIGALLELIVGADLALPRFSSFRRLCRRLAGDELAYPTCAALEHDYRILLRTYQQTGTMDVAIEPFAAALDPGRLAGRRDAEERLARWLADDGGEILWLNGEPGIGKTALLDWLEAHAAAAGILVWRLSFARIATDPAAQMRRLLAAATIDDPADPGGAAELVSRGVGAAAVSSDQPDLAPLPRLRRALRAFGATGPGTGTRSLLMVDDCQWADPTALDLLAEVASAPAAPSIVIASRSQVAVDPTTRGTDTDPVGRMLERPDLRWAPFSVPALDEPGVAAMLGTLLQPAATAGQLAVDGLLTARVMELTAGIPFYILRLVQQAQSLGLASFDGANRCWRLNPADLTRLGVTANVADALAGVLNELDPGHRRILAAAGCIGRPFTLEDLVAASGCSPEESAAAVWAGIERHLIRLAGEAGWTGAYLSLDAAYEFNHERIAEAARSTLASADQQRCHIVLGRHLVGRSDLLAAGPHLTLGAPVVPAAERFSTARELHLCGGEAVRALAFSSALHCYETAAALLAGSRDQAAGDLRIDCWLRAAGCCYQLGDLVGLDELLDWVERATSDRLYLARAAHLRVRGFWAREDVAAAASTARRALDRLGCTLPAAPARRHTAAAVMRGDLTLRRRAESVLGLRPCQDPVQLQTQQLVHDLFNCLYGAQPDLIPVVAVRGLQLSLRHGASPFTPLALATFGVIEAIRGRHDRAWRIGSLALTMAGREANRSTRSQVTFFHYAFVNHWREPMAAGLPALAAGFEVALSEGQPDFAGLLGVVELSHAVASGSPLDAVAQRAVEIVDALPPHRKVVALCELVRQMVDNLRGEAPDSGVLAGTTGYDEREEWRRALAEDDRVAITSQLLARLNLALWLGRYAEGVRVADELRPSLRSIAGSANLPLFHIAELLCRCRADPRSRRTQRIAREVLAAFTRWAEQAPANWEASRRLLLAAWAFSQGRLRDAEHEAEQALAAADSYGLPQVGGLARELLGEMCLATGRGTIGRYYLREAAEGFEMLGYRARVAYLVDRFGPLHERPASSIGSAAVPPGVAQSTVLVSASQAVADSEDDRGVVAAALGALLAATPTRSVSLMLRGDDEGMHPVAALERDRSLRFVADGAELPPALELPTRLVARTGQPLLVPAFGRSMLAADDPAGEIGSLLAVPVRAGGRPLGQLHLVGGHGDQSLTEEHRTVAEAVAALLSNGLQRIELAQQLSDSRTRIATLHEVNQRFIPEEFVSWLGYDDIQAVRLGDSLVKEVTVMFVDIRSFSALAEPLPPPELALLEIQFYQAVEPAILVNHGFIHSFRGDEILALFPQSPDHAVAAARSVVRVQTARREVAASRGLPAVEAGIGINTGLVSVGAIGGVQRMTPGIAGDAVNLASRIEGLTRRYQSQVLLSEVTFRSLSPDLAYDIRRVERVRVVNRATPVTVYEVFDGDDAVRRDAKRAMADVAALAFESYDRGDLDEARRCFARWAAELPDDPVPRIHLDRLVGADPGSWDPITTLDRK